MTIRKMDLGGIALYFVSVGFGGTFFAGMGWVIWYLYCLQAAASPEEVASGSGAFQAFALFLTSAVTGVLALAFLLAVWYFFPWRRSQRRRYRSHRSYA